jgi:hypothetical protein
MSGIVLLRGSISLPLPGCAKYADEVVGLGRALAPKGGQGNLHSTRLLTVEDAATHLTGEAHTWAMSPTISRPSGHPNV